MAPMWVERLGFAAAVCTTAAFVPQLVRVLRLKSARDVSLGTFLLMSVGVALWMLYGAFSGSRPILIANSITLVLSISILVLKLKYDRKALKE